MTLSVVLRTGVFDVGDYSDIVHLYRRDGLASHPAPYFDYPLEYPVINGAFVWAVGFVRSSAGMYFVASAAVLGALAVATVRTLERLPSTHPWLLAAAPAVAFWGVQNWDFLGIALLVAALLLHHRREDVGGAVLLALAVWAKSFPVVVLPVVLAVRRAGSCASRDPRDGRVRGGDPARECPGGDREHRGRRRSVSRGLDVVLRVQPRPGRYCDAVERTRSERRRG
jgi:hypothetical protein